jgi:chemotaxis protein MotB
MKYQESGGHKKKGEEEKKGTGESGTGRWMLTYLDMVTLLFGVFVLMYAMSNVDKKKVEQVAESIARALKTGYSFLGGNMSGKESTSPDFFPKNLIHEGESPEKIFDSLQVLFKEETLKQLVKIRQEKRGYVVSLGGDFFFAPGNVELRLDDQERSMLERLSNFLKLVTNEVVIEGHTDNIPYVPGEEDKTRYRDNWELSAARAVSVLHALLDYGDLDEKRFAVVGYGETKPLVSNATPEGRAYNRRVDIVVLRDQTITR